jgi:hypothetical protein
LEVPFLATVVGESGIGMMEVGDHNDCYGSRLSFSREYEEAESLHQWETRSQGIP